VYPIELYGDDRIIGFEHKNHVPHPVSGDMSGDSTFLSSRA